MSPAPSSSMKIRSRCRRSLRERLRALFTKPMAFAGPAAEQLAKPFMTSRSIFRNPTQRGTSIDAYIQAQEGLCVAADERLLEPRAVRSVRPAFVSGRWAEDPRGLSLLYPRHHPALHGANGKKREHATTSISLGPPLHRCLCWVVFVRLALPTIRVLRAPKASHSQHNVQSTRASPTGLAWGE